MPCRPLLALMILGLAGSAEAASPRRPAERPPDLQGTWTNESLTHLQRPAGLKTATLSEAEATAWEHSPAARPARDDPVGQATSEWIAGEPKLARIDGKARTGWITDPPDGRLPFTDAGLKLLSEAQAGDTQKLDNPENRPSSERCLMASSGAAVPPMLNAAYNSNYQIVQTPDHLVILAELNHDARIIPLAPDPRAATAFPGWLGNSAGHWEGDTLVIETTGFRPETAWRGPTRLYLSPGAKVTERLRRTSPDEIRYAFSVDDPQIYSRPWSGEMVLRQAKGPLFEFACHEGNYGLPGILAGARRQEADARR
jgi:hypothetical protein